MKKVLIKLTILAGAVLFNSCEKGSGTTLAGSDMQGGSLARFAMVDNYLYTVTNRELQVFDVQDEKNPISKGSLFVRNNVETIFPKGNNLFIGTQTGMLIYDVSKPLEIKLLGGYQHFRSCDPVVANDTLAFSTLNTNSIACVSGVNQLDVVDIKNKALPKKIRDYAMVHPNGLALAGNRLYVCDDVVKIFELGSGGLLTAIGTINTKAHDAIIRGNVLVLIGSDGLQQYDISSNTPRFLSKIATN